MIASIIDPRTGGPDKPTARRSLDRSLVRPKPHPVVPRKISRPYLTPLLCVLLAIVAGRTAAGLSIAETGAVGDGKTPGTTAIQKAIDQCASGGGGTVVVPPGRFLTGALFLKPGVNLHLEKDAVLLGSTNIDDYPPLPTRIEGHTQVWRPALVNAAGCDGLQITGEGTLEGGGKPFWEAFWSRLKADDKTKNLDVDRPRTLFISDSRAVLIQGISLRNSGFWNIHLYRCRSATVEKVDIRTPSGAPSTDGIDVDSCQDVTIRSCYISVDDDDIALKGTKGPLADQDKDSPAVEHIRISDCTFGLGHAVLTLGSEACHVRDAVMENCRVDGVTKENHFALLRLKLRPDTPQHYEDIHVRNVVLNAKGTLISIEPWTQYFDLKGQTPPAQTVENITITNVSGATGAFGRIAGPPHSTLRDITLADIDLKLDEPEVTISGVEGLVLKNVRINGAPVDASRVVAPPGAARAATKSTTFRWIPVCGVGAVLLAVPGAPAQDTRPAENSRLAWPEITAQSRPWTRWWWMGSAVDGANLDRELTRYQAAGLGGVEITPIYGVNGWADREIPYLTPAWMGMLDHAIDTGKRLGMETDMTTGTGWCFGGPTVTDADANAKLVAATQTVPAGGELTGSFDPTATQALVAFSADGKCVELTDRIRRDGHVDWSAAGGPWQVYAISQKPSGVMVKRAAPGGAGPMLNLFYPDAMGRYLQWFEQPFASAKPKLRALFHDSYEYNSDWGPDFFAQFEKLRGYRLQTELPTLLGPQQDDHAARVKSDYRETISDVMALQSIPAWVDWSHARGLLTRYQAHGSPGNLLDLYADADIPETEMFHTDRNILVSKFASSAAHTSGKNLASAETGTWLAEHFTETLGEMKGLADDMFLSGINHLVYHGTAYSPDDAPWPGWCFYASTEMNPRNSIWHDVAALNTYIARCQSVLQSGRTDNDILVYWPIYDSWHDARGMVKDFSVSGKDWFDGQPVGQTARRLRDQGYTFDYVSDRQIARVRVTYGGHLALGDMAYRAVVVPSCDRMPVDTFRQLLALAAGGANVIFDSKLPDDVPGWGNLVNRRNDFQSLSGSIKFHGQGQINVGSFESAFDRIGIHGESMTGQFGLQFVRRAWEGGRYYFIVNHGEGASNVWVTLATAARSVEMMDPLTGQTGMAQSRPTKEGETQVYLQIEPGGSMILRTFNTPEPGPAWVYRHAEGTPAELSGNWNVKFIDGGPVLPPPFQTAKLVSWAGPGSPDAQVFAGTALYSLTFPAPGRRAGPWSLDLGKVCQSARVRLNGKPLGTVFIPPFRVPVTTLLPEGNVLEVEVTNVSANRVRDLDIRHVPWKIFHAPNVLSVDYKPFDASGWPLTDSGLLGPVTLTPEKAED